MFRILLGGGSEEKNFLKIIPSLILYLTRIYGVINTFSESKSDFVDLLNANPLFFIPSTVIPANCGLFCWFDCRKKIVMIQQHLYICGIFSLWCFSYVVMFLFLYFIIKCWNLYINEPFTSEPETWWFLHGFSQGL